MIDMAQQPVLLGPVTNFVYSPVIKREQGRGPGDPDLLWSLLFGAHHELDAYRTELEALLVHAKDTDLLSDELISRLRSRNPVTRCGARAQLEVASLFSELSIPWTQDPQGRPGRIGDFEISIDRPIFTEVKAIFDRDDGVIREFISTKLWMLTERALNQSESCWLVTSRIRTFAMNFDGQHFSRWIRRRLAKGVPFEEEYSSSTGLLVLVSGNPRDDESAHLQSPPATDVSAHIYIRQSCEKAYEQLPDDRPTLVVLRSFLSVRCGEYDMINALYGQRQLSINLRTHERSEARAPDGFISPTRHRRVSAVAHLDVRGGERGHTYRLDFYHNPFARHPIPSERGTALVRHFAPHPDGFLRWTDDPTP